MKKILTCIIATMLFASFSANAQERYEKMGISFKVPKEWKIIDEQPETNAISFSCEKQGDNESGLVYFAYMGSEFDINSFLVLCMQNAENSTTMSEGKNFKWGGDTTDVNLGDFHARKVTYTVSFLELPFSGSIYVFNGCGNMVMLNTMEADEDRKKNKKGFDTIMGTIKCK